MVEPNSVVQCATTSDLSNAPLEPAPRVSVGMHAHPICPSPTLLLNPNSLSPAQVYENPLTPYMPQVLSEAQTRARLRNRAVPECGNPNSLTVEQKVAALANLHLAYWPPPEAGRLAQRIVAQIRTSLSLRNVQDPRYLRFYYGQADVMNGGDLKPMPDSLGSLGGAGVILAGPSGSGKSALLQRLRFLIGQQPVRIRGANAPAPVEFNFLPMLILRWPICGTLTGLLANLRDGILAEAGSSETRATALSNIAGRRGPSVAIATCIVMNLGVLVVDGMCLRSLQGGFREILDFLAAFKTYSGIPTILSCTYPALQAVTRGGSALGNLGSVAHESWDLEPQGPRWNACCRSFWNVGLHDPNVSMPDYLPEVLWDSTRGNMRLLTEAFSAIHHANAYDPNHPLTGTRATLTDLLEFRLRRFKEPLSVLAAFQESHVIPRKEDLYAYGDYLPFEAFSDTASAELDRMYRTKRLSRGA